MLVNDISSWECTANYRQTIGQYLWECHCKFVLDNNDETKHPESTGRWQHSIDSIKSCRYSRTFKQVPANQIWRVSRGIQKGCLSLLQILRYVSYQSHNTDSLMEHLESVQKFSFKYILGMHSNVKIFSMLLCFIAKQDWSNVYQILSLSF